MRLFKGSIERIKSGNIRLEEDLTNIIAEFFSNQPNIDKYEIVEKKNIRDILNQENELTGIAGELKWVVDVYGDVHLYDDDLINGYLFFKIRMLSGNLYCHCKHIKPSVIPTKLYGDIEFVPDEEEQWKNRHASGHTDDSLGGMEMLTTNVPTQASVAQKLSDLITVCISNGYDIDIEGIKQRLSKEWDNKDKYNIRIKTKKKKSDYLTSGDHFDCDIFVDDTKKLNLSAVEKSFYLAFIMMEDGVVLEDITTDFINIARQIYSRMSGKVQKMDNGLMSDNFFGSKNLSRTINSHRKNIRSAIEERISNKKIVDEFAVEGYKNEPVFVKRATPELRELIKQTFGLE